METKTQAFDFKIFFVVLILIGIGIAFMYGASAGSAEYLEYDPAYFFNRHLIFAFIAVIIILFVSKINPNVYFRFANILLIITIISLALVLIKGIGKEINGARRWIDFGLIKFQPSELTKVTLFIYLSKILSSKEDVLSSFKKGILPIFIVIGLVFVLILVEKDLSTSIIILVSSLSLIFIAGIPIRYLVFLAATGIPILFFTILSVSHMRTRLWTYLQTFSGSGLTHDHLKKSIKTIENADFFGSGLGIGSYRANITYSHTDFFFPGMIADVGLVGGLVVLGLFIFLYTKIFLLAYQVTDKRYSYLVLGINFILVYQTIVNLSGVLGLLPIAGVPLPLLSYGGNSLLSMALGLGMILGISKFQTSS